MVPDADAADVWSCTACVTCSHAERGEWVSDDDTPAAESAVMMLAMMAILKVGRRVSQTGFHCHAAVTGAVAA